MDRFPLSRLLGLALAAVVLLASGVPSPLPAISTVRAQGADRVRLGVLGVAADAGFFVASDQGYFEEQGLDVELLPFDSAAQMLPALATGQLDVGSGSHSAGLYNAVARGVGVRMVADRGSSQPGQGFQALLFRRDLVESGRLRDPGDLRGLRVAILQRGLITEVVLAQWLRRHGLTLGDVQVVELPFPDHVAALAGGAVDASVTIEPFVARILDQGTAIVYQRSDELYPGQQAAEVFYGDPLARERPDIGQRFMVAYLRGVRFYNDAFVKGDAARRQQVIASLMRHTPVRMRRCTSGWCSRGCTRMVA